MARHEKLSERTGLKVTSRIRTAPGSEAATRIPTVCCANTCPKEDLNGYSQQQLDAIAASLNARPRKSLGWKAPSELFLPKGAFDFTNTGQHQPKSTLPQTSPT